MYLHFYVWQLTAWTLILSRVTSAAAKANLGIWDIDESCTKYHDGRVDYNYGKPGGIDQTSYLQTAFDGALEIAQAGQSSLEFVVQKCPDKAADKAGYAKWLRIAEAMSVTLGFYPDPGAVDDPTTGHWARVKEIIDKMVATLPAAQNNPELGYNPELPTKPMIVCGENWQWLEGDAEIPGEGGEKVMDRFKSGFELGAVGAWFKKSRFLLVKRRKALPVKCIPGSKAVTNRRYNMVILCDEMFDNAVKARSTPAQIKTGKQIKVSEGLSEYRQQLTETVVHELMHWFGGVVQGSSLVVGVVRDQQTVDKDGKLLYVINGNEVASASEIARPSPGSGVRWSKMLAYGRENVWNLARSHTGPVAGNSGPRIATKNADSLTFFLFMMYYDDWSWAKNGVAKPVAA